MFPFHVYELQAVAVVVDVELFLIVSIKVAVESQPPAFSVT